VEDVHTSVFMLAKALMAINATSTVDDEAKDAYVDGDMRSGSSGGSGDGNNSGMKELSLIKLNPSLRRYTVF